MTISSSPAADGQLILDACKQAAEQAPEGFIYTHNKTFTPQTIQAELIRHNTHQLLGNIDNISLFLNVLTHVYGSRISTYLAQELDLEPAPGQPLFSDKVLQALNMAQTMHIVLEGVNFGEHLKNLAVKKI